MLNARVEGAWKLYKVAADIRKAGDMDMKRELYRGLNRATKPLKEAVKMAVPTHMPSGYAPLVSRSIRVRTSIRASKAKTAITIRATAKGAREKRDLRALDRGLLRHPVFGRTRLVRKGKSLVPEPNPWAAQGIRPGFFTETLQDNADVVRTELVGAIDRVADQLERG